MYIAIKSGAVKEVDSVAIKGKNIVVMLKATSRPRTYRANSVSVFDSAKEAFQWIKEQQEGSNGQ